MARSTHGTRSTPGALGLAAALAIPLRVGAATTVSLPDAAIRAGADLWFEEHIAPSLRAPSHETPGSLLGTAAPAPENPLPARAPGRHGFVGGGLAPTRGDWADPIQPVGFSIQLAIPHA